MSATWGEDSDDNDDPIGDGENNGSPPPSSIPSSGLMTAVDTDGEDAPGQRGTWGSDDGQDVFGFRSSRFLQPSRMAAAPAAAGVGSTSHAAASWVRDGEEEDGSDSDQDDDDDPFFPSSYPTRTGARPAPARVDAHHHRDDSGGVVVAPWMPHAQGRSGLGEPDHSWADEDDGNLGEADDLDRLLMGRLRRPEMSATLPVLDDIDLTGRGDDALRAVNFSATYPEPSATPPSTAAPSPWFTTRWNFGRPSPPGDAGSGDHEGRYRWSSQTAATPRRDQAWRDLRPTSNVAVPRRSDSSTGKTTESSPMHHPWIKGDVSEHRSPALPPAREHRSWVQRAFRSVRRLCKRAVKELGPLGARNRGQGKKVDDDSGVLAWKWWDNFKNAPGLAGRLAVCILAVCALWSTSLNVVGEKLFSVFTFIFTVRTLAAAWCASIVPSGVPVPTSRHRVGRPRIVQSSPAVWKLR